MEHFEICVLKLIIKLISRKLTKKHKYTTIQNTQPSFSTPKDPKTRYDQRC